MLILFSNKNAFTPPTVVFFEKKIYFHMRKKSTKNTSNKTTYKKQSKEKTIEQQKVEQNEIKERAAKMCSNALTST